MPDPILDLIFRRKSLKSKLSMPKNQTITMASPAFVGSDDDMNSQFEIDDVNNQIASLGFDPDIAESKIGDLPDNTPDFLVRDVLSIENPIDLQRKKAAIKWQAPVAKVIDGIADPATKARAKEEMDWVYKGIQGGDKSNYQSALSATKAAADIVRKHNGGGDVNEMLGNLRTDSEYGLAKMMLKDPSAQKRWEEQGLNPVQGIALDIKEIFEPNGLEFKKQITTKLTEPTAIAEQNIKKAELERLGTSILGGQIDYLLEKNKSSVKTANDFYNNSQGRLTELGGLIKKDTKLTEDMKSKLAGFQEEYDNAIAGKDGESFTSPYNFEVLKDKVESKTATPFELKEYNNRVGKLNAIVNKYKGDFDQYNQTATEQNAAVREYNKILNKIQESYQGVGDYNSLSSWAEYLAKQRNTLGERYPEYKQIELEGLVKDIAGDNVGLGEKTIFRLASSIGGEAVDGIRKVWNNLTIWDGDRLRDVEMGDAYQRRVEDVMLGYETGDQMLKDERSIIPVVPKDVQEELNKIKNSNLSEEEKYQQNYAVVSKAFDGKKIQYVANPRYGKYNITADAILNTASSAMSSIVGMYAQSYLAGGFGNVSKLRRMITQFASVGSLAFSREYDAAVQRGDGNPFEQATAKAIVEGLSEFVFDDIEFIKKAFPQFRRVAGDMTSAQWRSMTAGKIPSALKKEFVTAVEAIAKDGIIEEGTAQVGGNLVDKYIFGKDKDITEGLDVAMLAGVIGIAPLSIIGLPLKYRSANMGDKLMIYQAGYKADQVIENLNQQVADGAITAEEAKQRIESVKLMKEVVGGMSMYDVNGKPLTDNQKAQFAWNEYTKLKAKNIDTLPPQQRQDVEQVVQEADESSSNILNGTDNATYESTRPLQGVPTEGDSQQPQSTTEGQQGQVEATQPTANVSYSDFSSQEVDVQEAPQGLTEIAAKVFSDAIQTAKSLVKTGIKVRVFQNQADFERESAKLGQQARGQGAFVADGKNVLINLSKIKDANDWGIVWHEGAHPVMNILRNTNPELYDNMAKGFTSMAGQGGVLSQVTKWAQGDYKQKSTDSQTDEAMVETISLMADGKIGLQDIPVGFRQQVIDFINGIADYLGLGQLADTSERIFTQKAAQIAQALTTGEDISSVVGRQNVTEFMNNISDPQVVTGGVISLSALQSRDTSAPVINVYEAKGVAKLPQKTLKEIYDQFGGKAVVINSDPTRVGELTLPSGKKIFMYGGPAYLSVQDNVDGNVGFATTQISKVNTWSKYVNELFGGQPGVTFVATQAPTSILSNSYALRYVMDAISMLPKSVLKSQEFKNEFFGNDLVLLKDAFGEKGYNDFVNKYKKADLSKPEVIDGMIAEMAYKIGDDNKPASFKARGAFVANLLGGLDLKSKTKSIEGDVGYYSKTPNKFISKQLMDRLGINAEKLMRDIGEPSLVDLYINEGKWGFAVAGFESDPNMDVESVQAGGVKHPLFNAKFPGKNAFILDGAYEINKMFKPIEMKGPKGGDYTKTAAQMLAGSMYVKGDATEGVGTFEYSAPDASGRRIQERNTSLLAPNGKPSNLNEKQYQQVRTPEFKAWFGDWENDPTNSSKVLDENGEPIVVYHGTGTTIEAFDPSFTGKGNDQYGSGFYFTTKLEEANGYRSATQEGKEKPGGVDNPNVIEAFLSIKNPINVSGYSLNDADIELSEKQSFQILMKAPNIMDSEESPLGDWYESYWSKGPSVDMVRKVSKNFVGKSLTSLEGDFFRGDATKFREALNEVLGYDGVVQTYDNGTRHYIAWFPNQVKSSTSNKGTFSTTDNRIQERGTSARLIAPNGNPSNLTPKQYEQVRTPEFKTWFGDWENDPTNASKVIDENGEPLVVYHGTDNTFDEFVPSTAQGWGNGIYFTDNKEQTSEFGKNTVEGYLSIKNPITDSNYYQTKDAVKNTKAWTSATASQRKRWNDEELELDFDDAFQEDINLLNTAWKELGYDGIIFEGSNSIDGIEYVAFNSNQIKSATDNKGTFSTTDNRMQERGTSTELLAPNGKPSNLTLAQYEQVRTPQFKNWFGDWENDSVSKILDENGEPMILYHGSKNVFDTFKSRFDDGMVFLTTNPQFAANWMKGEGGIRTRTTGESSYEAFRNESRAYKEKNPMPNDDAGYESWRANDPGRFSLDADTNIYPVFSNATMFDPSIDSEFNKIKPFLIKKYGSEAEMSRMISAGGNRSNWFHYEDKVVSDGLKGMGYEGIWISEKSDKNAPSETAAIFGGANKIKSAIGNSGQFSTTDNRIQERGSSVVADLNNAIQNRTSAAKITSKAIDNVKDIITRLGYGHLPEDVQERLKKKQRLIDADMNDMNVLSKRLEDAIKDEYGVSYKKLDDDTKALLDDALRNFGTEMSVREKNALANQIPDSVLSILEQMRATVDGMSLKLIDIGVLDDSLEPAFDGDKGLGVYLTRTYRKYDDPEWVKKIPEPVRQRAIAYLKANNFVREFDAQGNEIGERELTDAEIEGLVSYIATNMQPVNEGLQSANLGKTKVDILKGRKVIPEEIRDLMGEYKDPMVNFARSIAKMANLVHTHQALKAIAEGNMGTIFFDRPTGEYFTPIAGEGKTYLQPLSGLYTTPEIAEAFKQVQANFEGDDINLWFLRTLAGINGFAKVGKTALSPASWVRNVIGGHVMMLKDAHLFGSGYAEGWKKAIGYFANKSQNDPEFQAKIREYIEQGILGDGVQAGEFQAIIKAAQKHDNPMDWLKNDSKLGKFVSGVKGFYSAQDDIFRVWAYENEKARLQKRKPNMNDKELSEEASRKARATYPTYSELPEAIRQLAKFIPISSFPAFSAELIRTTKNSFKIAIEEIRDPDMKDVGYKRLAGVISAISFGSIISGVSAMLVGVGDEEEKSVRRYLPEWSRNSPLVWLGRDENGLPKYIDMGFSDPFSYFKKPVVALMNEDNEMGDRISNAVGEVAAPFVSPEIFLSALMKGTKKLKETDGLDDKLGKYAGPVYEALEPGLIASLRRIGKGLMGDVDNYGQQYDAGLETLAFFSGQRIKKMDIPVGFSFKSKEFISAKRDIMGDYYVEKAKTSGNPEDQAEALADANEKMVKYYDNFKRDYDAAIVLMTRTMTAREAKKILKNTMKDRNVPSDFIKAIEKNKPYPTIEDDK